MTGFSAWFVFFFYFEMGLSCAGMEVPGSTVRSVLSVECTESQACLKSLFQGTNSSFYEEVIDSLQKTKKLIKRKA